jgi:hypothetical protein
VFNPLIDRYGRVIFTRWDHLQRDQQNIGSEVAQYQPFNWSDESPSSVKTSSAAEVFPEPKTSDPNLVAPLLGNDFKQFFPWQINEDGTGEETLNHVGRHELSGYFNAALSSSYDPNMLEHDVGTGANQYLFNDGGLVQLSEDPLTPGVYYSVNAPEFTTHASGPIVRTVGPLGMTADKMTLTALTAESTGHYRSPVRLSDGSFIAVHTAVTATADGQNGSTVSSNYDFRLKSLKAAGAGYAADAPLTPGIMKTVTNFDSSSVGQKTYSGNLWELDPVEVRVRPRPTGGGNPDTIGMPEQSLFDAVGTGTVAKLRAWLAARNLALIVMRNVTTRDSADQQQPFNLHVAGSATQTVGKSGKIYDISYFQIVQGDQLRSNGITGGYGRRVLPQYLHDPSVQNQWAGPSGAVQIFDDGSVAAFVPARRAMSWQTTDASGNPVVRERYWITFQPGEIRTCTSCHGINSTDQAGRSAPTNSPKALTALLTYWQTLPQ